MTKLVAFDIDDALTDEDGMNKWQEKKEEADYIGIVSARPPEGIDWFLSGNDIDADFIRSSILKGMELRKLAREYDTDEKLYFGSKMKDRVHARLAGWEYKQL